MGNQLYAHPDGHSIDLAKGMLTVTDSDGHAASVPIGEIGLTELGERMVSIGRALITERDTAEQAGAAMGLDLINELLAVQSEPQAEAFRAIRDKLYALSKLEQFDAAAGGFAGAVVNVLEIGIANLPKFEREES